MKYLKVFRAVLISVGFIVCLVVATGLTQSAENNDNEVFIMIAGYEHRYQPRPELGYVVKLSEDSESLFSTLTQYATPVGGRESQGLWIVERRQSAAQNRAIIKTLSVQSQVQYVAPLFSRGGEIEAIIPEIVIRVSAGTKIEMLSEICRTLNLQINRKMIFTEQEYLVDVSGANADAVFYALIELNGNQLVEWAAPNVITQRSRRGPEVSELDYSETDIILYDARRDSDSAGFIPDDEFFPSMWHLHNTGQLGGTPDADINAPEAWEITAGDPNIIICVQDTGVDLNHPDLANNLVPGYDFYQNDDLPEPLSSSNDAHGTGCAGLVAADGNNEIGVIGVAWGCKLMPTRDRTFSSISIADVADGFRWAATNGADIISYSSGWKNPRPVIYSAVVDITKPGGIGRNGKGCIVCVAAGNSGGSLPSTDTSAYEEVIGVGATDHNDVRWPYSVYGPELDVVAPSGQNHATLRTDPARWLNEANMVLTTDIAGPAGRSGDSLYRYGDEQDYGFFGGTSAACPITAGVAALILSIEPDLTNDEVRHFLTRSAKDLGGPGRDDYYGWGRVDARAALGMVLAKRCDLNNDWKVDEQDLTLLNEYIDTNDLSGDIAPAAKRDGKVDELDIELMMQYFGTEIFEPGIIAHWRLDETEGDVAINSIGGNDGLIHGEPVWQPDGGMINGALELDGIDDYISTPFILDPSAHVPFSVFAWIIGGVPGQTIISQANGQNWIIAESSEGRLASELFSARIRTSLISDVVIIDGEWHRVGVVWNESQGTKILYVDNVEVATDKARGEGTSEDGLYIGAGNNTETGSLWSGLIDDVRIYNRAITP